MTTYQGPGRFYFSVFADYHQFSLRDDKIEEPIPDWNDQALSDRMVVSRAAVTFATARNMPVPVIVEVAVELPRNEAGNFDTWDHAAQCSIEVPSGILVVHGIEYWPDAPRIRLEPGTYQLRICHGGLETLSDDGLVGEDVYVIQVAPGPAIETRILKRARSPLERGG